jgi:hypothetical protein
MSFLSPDQLRELIQFASIADKEARSDLMGGFIKDENDYTSNFTGALRRIINSNSQSGLSATSFLLTHGEERECGADAAIILSRGNQSKVAVFEAKWPRFKTPGYAWDHAQTDTGLSHYSDQLARQKSWLHTFAVFEMFYNEYAFGTQPPFLDKEGSSCVWHDDAESFNTKRKRPDVLWTQDELKVLLQKKQITIGMVMKEFGECLKGKAIPIPEPEAVGREYRLPRQLLAIRAAGESK